MMKYFCNFLTLIFPVFLSISFIGCENKFSRLASENAEATQAQKKRIEKAIEVAKTLPEASNKYQEWVAAKSQIDSMKMLANSDLIEENVREQLQKRVQEFQDLADKAYLDVKIECKNEIRFDDNDMRNATTLFLDPDGRADGNEFSIRNELNSSWFVDGPSNSNIDEAAQYYRDLLNLEYILVIRQVDISLPTHEGEDSSGNHSFKLGAIECDAFLIDLESAEKIASFRFVMPGQRSTLGFAGVDITIPNDPVSGVNALTSRLYSDVHNFSKAVAGELSENIYCKHKITRDLLGVRLEEYP